MATIKNLTLDRERVCQGESVTIEVETEPDGAEVQWTVAKDGGVPEPLFGSAPIKQLSLSAGTHEVTVQVDASQRSVIVVVVGLKIEFDPPPANGPWVITAEPRMPTVLARAVGINGAVSNVVWGAETRFFGVEFCATAPPGLQTNFEFPQPSGTDLLRVDFGAVIRGGPISVFAYAIVDGCEQRASWGNLVVGENPPQEDVEAALPNAVLRAIACRESTQRQFQAPPYGGQNVCPLFRANGKVGMMGIKNASDEEIWNWRANVSAGIEIFNQRLAEAAEYPRRIRESARFEQLVTEFNAIRAELSLEPIAITLQDFTSGDLDASPQQLERDAIRGYDGWEGTDHFGFELHEYRVAMEVYEGNEILRVVNFDQATQSAEAMWERVPITARPAGDANPNYVSEVLAFMPGCSSEVKHSCGIQIVASVEARTFGPAIGADPLVPGSLTGTEVLEARTGSLPQGSAIYWELDSPTGWLGTVSFRPRVGHHVTMLAGHPNKARVVARVRMDGDILCESDPVSISVPQFFALRFNASFDTDLERLGLKRRDPPIPEILSAEQTQTNDDVRRAIIMLILSTARFRFNANGFNARFLDGAIPQHLAANTSVVNIGGVSPFGDAFGEKDPDPGNQQADDVAFVYSGEVLEPTGLGFGDPIFRSIFDGLAIEDYTGQPLPGVPVDAGDFVPLDREPAGPGEVRQRHVQAAIIAFGRFIGHVVAHECGHALGLTHPEGFQIRIGYIMDKGGQSTLQTRTGILGFDVATGQLDRMGLLAYGNFRPGDIAKLGELLPAVL